MEYNNYYPQQTAYQQQAPTPMQPPNIPSMPPPPPIHQSMPSPPMHQSQQLHPSMAPQQMQQFMPTQHIHQTTQPQQMHQSMPPPSMHQPPPQQTPRLDLHAMPSVAEVTLDEIEKCNSEIIFQAPASLPPLVATLESVQPTLIDEGCARPCHMRSTIYTIPASKEKLQVSGIDFAIVVNPFDINERSNLYIPQSESPIIRCNRCKAYMNPYMDFVDNGRSFRCCICTHINPLPNEYVSNLDHTGKRVDRYSKPELHLGSYEFRTTKEYYRGEIEVSRRPHIIFALELTCNSKQLVTYISKNLASVIKEALPTDFAYSSKLCPLVAFVTYNSQIQLYDVVNGGHAYIISDMSAVTELASTSKFLIDPTKNLEAIEHFLESLPDLCPDIELETQTILGPVIEAAFKTCTVDTSNWFPNPNEQESNGTSKKMPANFQKVIPTGKMYIFHASLPTHGVEGTPGRLALKRNIEDLKKFMGTEKEKDILSAEGKYYTQLAQKCVSEYGSGIELFLFPQSPRTFMNVATLCELVRLTGTGVINKYYNHSCPDGFIKDLKYSLKSTMAFDASMRVRASTGISPYRYIGNFNDSMSTNIEMATVNTNSNFIVMFKYDENLPENEMVVVQFAMIYTSLYGERRVRVHNVAFSTCDLLGDLFKTACCDTLVNVLIRDTIDKMRSGSLSPKGAKEQLTNKVITILHAYRRHCTENHAGSLTQLVLPEVLKLLPAYLCGSLKCDAIDGGPEIFMDDKVIAQINLLGSTVSQTHVTVYPRMYTIRDFPGNSEEEPFIDATLTRCYSLAIEEENGKCYILENGYYLFIYFPNSYLGQACLEEVFGSRKEQPDLSWEWRQPDSPTAIFLDKFVEEICERRRRTLKLSVVRQGRDRLESIFKLFLYEDKKRQDSHQRGPEAFKLDNASYVEVLCSLHQEIRSKLHS